MIPWPKPRVPWINQSRSLPEEKPVLVAPDYARHFPVPTALRAPCPELTSGCGSFSFPHQGRPAAVESRKFSSPRSPPRIACPHWKPDQLTSSLWPNLTTMRLKPSPVRKSPAHLNAALRALVVSACALTVAESMAHPGSLRRHQYPLSRDLHASLPRAAGANPATLRTCRTSSRHTRNRAFARGASASGSRRDRCRRRQ